MDLKYVRDLDQFEQLFYGMGTCIRVYIRIEGTIDKEAAKKAHHKLLKAYPALRAFIVGNQVKSAFYLSNLKSNMIFTERENLDKFLEINSILNTSEVARFEIATDNKLTIVSLTIRHSIADGKAAGRLALMFFFLMVYPDTELPEMPFPYGVREINTKVKTRGVNLEFVKELLPSLPLSPSGVPVDWNNYYQSDSTLLTRIVFTKEETQKITDSARAIGTVLNSAVVSAIILSEYTLFGTEDHEKWAAIQVVDYRNHIKPRPAPTDGTNIVGWHPELYPVHAGMTEKELSSIVWKRLSDGVKDGSIINNTVDFSARMNTSPDLNRLKSVGIQRAASIISNIGSFPRVPESPFNILEIGGHVLSVGPRFFYLIANSLRELSITISYPGNDFIQEKDIQALKNTLIERLMNLE